ncbi:gmc oxidoreductase, partial [Moniliophthora roreri]
PTPGKSTLTGTPAASNTALGPTPLAKRTCGVPMAPEVTITSRLTLTHCCYLEQTGYVSLSS